MPSEDVLLSIRSRHPACGLSEADLPASGILQGFGGTAAALTSVPASGSRSCPPTAVPGPVAAAACTVGEVTGSVRGITPRARTTRQVEHQ